MTRIWVLAAGAYLAVMLGALLPVWTGSVEPIWDGADFNYPSLAFAVDAFASGRLPLWDPLTNCGQPFFAEPHLAWYQPAALAVGALLHSHLTGYMVWWTIVWLWAGLGAFVLAAALGARPLGAIVAALSFALSGFFIGNAEHLPHLMTISWFPWALASAHLAVGRAHLGWAVLAGAALGASALGGYPGLVIFEGVAMAMWLVLAFLVRSPAPGDAAGTLVQRARRVAVTLAFAAALLAAIWAPALYAFFREGGAYTGRTALPSMQEALTSNRLSLRALLSLVMPRLVVSQPRLFPADISMNDVYVGALTVPLLGVWIASGVRRSLWLVAFIAIWVLMSLGGDGGLLTAFDSLVPIGRFMRYPAVLRAFAILGLAIGAGLGLDVSLSEERGARRLRRAALVWAVAALGVIGVAAAAFSLSPSQLTRFATPVLLACLVVAIATARKDSAAAFMPLGLVVLVVVAADMVLHLRLDTETVWVKDRRLHRVERAPKHADPGGAREDFGITRIHLIPRIPVVGGFPTLVSSFEYLAGRPFRGVLAHHRYWLSPAAHAAPPLDSGLEWLANLGAGSAIPILLSPGDLPASLEGGAPVVPGTYGSARVVSYLDDEVALAVSVPSPRDAILASTERFAPSWEATVDGAGARVLVVNYYFRGVRVPPGDHIVVFRYRPTWFAPLLAASWLVLCGSAVAGVVLVRRQRRSP